MPGPGIWDVCLGGAGGSPVGSLVGELKKALQQSIVVQFGRSVLGCVSFTLIVSLFFHYIDRLITSYFLQQLYRGNSSSFSSQS
jgi:hypothetical protein